MMSNAMMIIYPYRDRGDWVFDDESVGLVREPFVFGVPEMIDRFVADVPGAEHGFKLIFSAKPFPGYQARLSWLREEYEGNWYRLDESEQEGWLCPALFKYFEKVPKEIYCRAEASDEKPLWRR
jgi:hypothetical protein